MVCHDDEIKHDLDLLIEGNTIAAIGTDLVQDPDRCHTVLDGRGKLVMPGLINSHTHLWQSFLKGKRDDLPLTPWCDEIILPFLKKLTQCDGRKGSGEISYLWSMLGAMEMVRSGITTVIDMDLGFQSHLIPQAWVDLGMRGVIAVEMSDQWGSSAEGASIEDEMENVLDLVERWHRPWTGDNLVQVALGPSAPFICSETLLAWVKQQAETYGLGIQIHVSETKGEVEEALARWGKHPLEYLETTGLLSCPVSAVHCVHLTPQEIELARRYAVVPVYCPKSNMKLGSGVAPLKEMLDAGLEIALATDGAASNDLLDPFEEMRAGVMLQKATREDPAAASAHQLLRMATSGGAKACRLDAGIIAPGKLADLVILDFDAPHLLSFDSDLVPALVYCAKAGDVESVIINGKLVMRDRKFLCIDEDLLYDEIVAAGRYYADGQVWE